MSEWTLQRFKKDLITSELNGEPRKAFIPRMEIKYRRKRSAIFEWIKRCGNKFRRRKPD